MNLRHLTLSSIEEFFDQYRCVLNAPSEGNIRQCLTNNSSRFEKYFFNKKKIGSFDFSFSNMLLLAVRFYSLVN